MEEFLLDLLNDEEDYVEELEDSVYALEGELVEQRRYKDLYDTVYREAKELENELEEVNIDNKELSDNIEYYAERFREVADSLSPRKGIWR